MWKLATENDTWALDYNNLVINYVIQQNFMQYETEVTISRVKMTNILMVYTHTCTAVSKYSVIQ